jgi:hypothetical protein
MENNNDSRTSDEIFNILKSIPPNLTRDMLFGARILAVIVSV